MHFVPQGGQFHAFASLLPEQKTPPSMATITSDALWSLMQDAYGGVNLSRAWLRDPEKALLGLQALTPEVVYSSTSVAVSGMP